MPDMPELILYSTSACHLCELAEQLLAQSDLAPNYQLRKVDIAESEELVARYGVRIPVLCRAADGQELGWPFDHQQLACFLDA